MPTAHTIAPSMTTDSVISNQDQLSVSWLSRVLKQSVEMFNATADSGNWSRQLSIKVTLSDGTTRALRLKMCLGNTFGRSEVDYYTKDYLRMVDAPLVRCFDAHYDARTGYHLLLEDLAASHTDNKFVPPTLSYGIAVAREGLNNSPSSTSPCRR
jgi:hypothetical protein